MREGTCAALIAFQGHGLQEASHQILAHTPDVVGGQPGMAVNTNVIRQKSPVAATNSRNFGVNGFSPNFGQTVDFSEFNEIVISNRVIKVENISGVTKFRRPPRGATKKVDFWRIPFLFTAIPVRGTPHPYSHAATLPPPVASVPPCARQNRGTGAGIGTTGAGTQS